ncbi:MAG: ABC transporter permease [Lachnospiraceae bacterium]|nr:ABC transporter permease [Lachnospiraceae bacterium]
MQEKNKSNALSIFLGKYGIVVMLLALVLVMTILIPGFLSLNNIKGILVQGSIYGIMSLGITFIIISGGIDLSAGSLVALTAVISASFGQQVTAQNRLFPFLPELGIWAPILVALVFGGFLGAINGLMIAKLRLLPWIATLGSFYIARGVALVITKGKPVTQLIRGYYNVGKEFFGLPVPVWIFLLCIIVSWVLLNYTKFGCDTFAIGGNISAARVTGINISKTLILIYLFAGVMYGVAAFVYSGRVLSVNPGAAQNYEMSAISASIIGGTSPVGGKGTIWGVIVGTLILSVIRQGLTLLAVDAYWQQIAEGAIIVVAVIFAMRRNK